MSWLLTLHQSEPKSTTTATTTTTTNNTITTTTTTATTTTTTTISNYKYHTNCISAECVKMTPTKFPPHAEPNMS